MFAFCRIRTTFRSLRNSPGAIRVWRRYIRSFPQTSEFINRISDLLIYLLPHYIREGKSYLTISFGCTGGHHRSVFIANEIQKRLKKAGYTLRKAIATLRSSS